MRILHVVPLFGLGGMERVICAVINGTAKSYTHEILVLHDDCAARKWIHQESMQISCLHKSNDYQKFIKRLFRSIKDIRPDVMMTYCWGGTDAIWVGRLLGITRIIHNEHGFNMDEARTTSLRRNLMRALLYRMAHKVVVVSQALKKDMVTSMHIDADHVQFIANGIDAKVFVIDPCERNKARESLGFTEENFVIGYVGRLDPVKNFDLMIETLRICLCEDNNVRMLIVGDGQERARIEQLCSEKQIRAYVTFVPKTANVLPYVSALDAFLLTSLREQMPMTILEAMALEVPVVVSKVGELPYILSHGKDGMLVDLAEPPAVFAQALLVLRDPARRRAMGTAARHKVVTAYQAEAMVEKYRTIFDGHGTC